MTYVYAKKIFVATKAIFTNLDASSVLLKMVHITQMYNEMMYM